MHEALLAQAPTPAASGHARTLLSVAGLNCWYGESHVLHGVDFEIRVGEIVTLIGRNGAGKTTTLKALMGLLQRRSGSLMFDGVDLGLLSPRRIAAQGIGYVPEERGIYASLTVAENLRLPPITRPGGYSEEEIFTLFPNLRERLRSFGNLLSGGEQQMLAIARVLRSGARLILLDEPTEGLAPVIVQQIGKALQQLKARGYTVLLVEQNLQFTASVADRHYLMETGRVVDSFANADMAANQDKLHRYLGV
jgi:branched-chain amino acid transport system ATP-binding protein